MKKALKFLKRINRLDTPYNFLQNELDEAIAELEAMKQRTCEGCKNYSNDNSHKAWECVKAHKFVMCGHAFEPPKDFCCSLFELKNNK